MVMNLDQLKNNFQEDMAFPIRLTKNQHLLRAIAELGGTAEVQNLAEINLAKRQGFTKFIFTGMKYDYEEDIVEAMKIDALIVVEKY